jgi:hypothetical protein
MRIRTKPGHASTGAACGETTTSSTDARPSAVEEPALQKRENLLACERPRVGGAAVSFEHPHVVLERLVGPLERVLELVSLEDHVVRARLFRIAEMRIDGPPDHPDRPCPTLEPDCDPLLLACVVDPEEPALRIPAFPRVSSHAAGIQSRSLSAFKNLFSFLFQRSPAEEHVARYVIREHDRGRPLEEVLQDRYVQNRLTPEQQKRLLDRPELVGAISRDVLEEAKASID